MSPKGTAAVRRLLSVTTQARSYSAPADRSIPAAKQKYVPSSGTYPKGFLAGSAFAGVKASNTKYDDMALVVSEETCPAAAIFTKNIFQAAPVKVSKKLLWQNRENDPSATYRGVVVNSGCANAVTGSVGLEHAEIMARTTDECFSDSSDTPKTLVMSTGVIGQRLPIDRITEAIPKLHANLGSSHEHWMNAAKAICTTDTFPKLLSRTFTLPSHPQTTYSIAGMTKGAGMIHPNMGTLLGIICTDVKIEQSTMKRILDIAATDSFNSISIDGDTSTNDTVAFFANGAAAPDGVDPISAAPNKANGVLTHWSEDTSAFQKEMAAFMTDLAKLVVRDGEGATKFVTIRVRSGLGKDTAKRAAESIAKSALVKTALYGKDANWGRILCAIGYAPGIMPAAREKQLNQTKQVIPTMTSVSFIPADGSEELKLLVRGEPEEVDEVRAKQILEMEDLEILVRLEDSDKFPADGSESHESVMYTCDLSHEYVTINGDYRT